MKKEIGEQERGILLEAYEEFNKTFPPESSIDARLVDILTRKNMGIHDPAHLTALRNVPEKLEIIGGPLSHLNIDDVKAFLKYLKDEVTDEDRKEVSQRKQKLSTPKGGVVSLPKKKDSDAMVKEIAGIFYLFRLSSDGRHIKCFPLIITGGNSSEFELIYNDQKSRYETIRNDETTFNVIIKELIPGEKLENARIFVGNASFTDGNSDFLTIRMKYKDGKVGFHPRMIFHVPQTYRENKFKYVEGVSLRTGGDYSVISNREVLVRDSSDQTFSSMSSNDFKIGSVEYLELNHKFDSLNLAFHLTGIHQNVIKTAHSPEKKSEKEDLSKMYFRAACLNIIQGIDAQPYLDKAVEYGFNDLNTFQECCRKHAKVRSYFKKNMFRPMGFETGKHKV